MKKNINLKRELNFVKTCDECPEQYDVFDEDGYRVAYVRLRQGWLSVECPTNIITDDNVIFGMSTEGDVSLTSRERPIVMDMVKSVINHWIDTREEVSIGEVYACRFESYPSLFRVVGFCKDDECVKEVIIDPIPGVSINGLDVPRDTETATTIPHHMFSTRTNSGSLIIESIGKYGDSLRWTDFMVQNLPGGNCIQPTEYISEVGNCVVSRRPYVLTCDFNDSGIVSLHYTFYAGTSIYIQDLYKMDNFNSFLVMRDDNADGCGSCYNPAKLVKFAKSHNLKIGLMAFKLICNELYGYLLFKYGEKRAAYDLDTYLPEHDDYETVIIDDYRDYYDICEVIKFDTKWAPSFRRKPINSINIHS